MLYEAVLTYTVDGQTCINRFNYRLVVDGGLPRHADNLALAMGLDDLTNPTEYFNGSLLWTLAAMQASVVVHEQLFVRNLYDTSDFVQIFLGAPFTGTFQPPSETAASWYTAGFRGVRTDLSVRNAQKRFSGIPQSVLAQLGTYTSDYLTLNMQPMAERLGEILVAGGDSFEPVVLKRERYTVPNSDPPRKAYKLFEDPEVQNQNAFRVPSWQEYGRQRTQGSRKLGVGQ